MCLFFSRRSEFIASSGSSTVMDTQYIQGEGVPPKAGEGQHHHRPDQWYMSLHQPTVSFCLSRRTDNRKKGSCSCGRKNPSNPGGSTLSGFSYQRRLFKKRSRKVSVERRTHVPSEPKTPAARSREGGGLGAGREGLDPKSHCLMEGWS